jgi:hypothetical protein
VLHNIGLTVRLLVGVVLAAAALRALAGVLFRGDSGDRGRAATTLEVSEGPTYPAR